MWRSGGQWRMLPRWFDAGVFDRLTDDLHTLLRQMHGWDPELTACVLDSRILQSTPESGGTGRL